MLSPLSSSSINFITKNENVPNIQLLKYESLCGIGAAFSLGLCHLRLGSAAYKSHNVS